MSPSVRPRRLSRRSLVLIGLAASVALAVLGRTTWMTASVATLGGGHSSVPVSGTDAAPAVLALAIVALAASLATAISSPLIRFATGPVLVASGIGAAAAALAARADPATRAEAAVASSTGVAGQSTQVSVSAWPLAALVPAAVIVVTGVLILVAGRSWPRRSRYERDAARPAAGAAGGPLPQDPRTDPAGTWDALSRGEDPTRD